MSETGKEEIWKAHLHRASRLAGSIWDLYDREWEDDSRAIVIDFLLGYGLEVYRRYELSADHSVFANFAINNQDFRREVADIISGQLGCSPALVYRVILQSKISVRRHGIRACLLSQVLDSELNPESPTPLRVPQLLHSLLTFFAMHVVTASWSYDLFNERMEDSLERLIEPIEDESPRFPVSIKPFYAVDDIEGSIKETALAVKRANRIGKFSLLSCLVLLLVIFLGVDISQSYLLAVFTVFTFIIIAMWAGVMLSLLEIQRALNLVRRALPHKLVRHVGLFEQDEK